VRRPWGRSARAQQQVMPVIGFMHVGTASSLVHLVSAFRQGLEGTDNVEGRNVAIEDRWAEGRNERLTAFAVDFVRGRVAVIVTGGGEASAKAAKTATSTIPIVFNVGSDPVRAGLIASLGRPGGNVPPA
jgi:putative tryptophan/tyrosine transport system substrate-binding protein